MVAAAHQRLNALTKGFDTDKEIIKRQQHAVGTGTAATSSSMRATLA